MNAFPFYNDLNTIEMKIVVIDVINSTHLLQYKSKLSLRNMAKVILGISNFDYKSFNKCVGKLLDENNIHIPFIKRKFDYDFKGF